MATGTLTLRYSGPGGNQEFAVSKTGTAGGVLIDGETITTGTTDGQIVMALDVSAVKTFFLVSTQDIQLETNAVNASGGNTLALNANEPYIWHVTDLDSFKLTADVTTTYWTNTSGSTATIYCYAVWDATPP